MGVQKYPSILFGDNGEYKKTNQREKSLSDQLKHVQVKKYVQDVENYLKFRVVTKV